MLSSFAIRSIANSSSVFRESIAQFSSQVVLRKEIPKNTVALQPTYRKVILMEEPHKLHKFFDTLKTVPTAWYP